MDETAGKPTQSETTQSPGAQELQGAPSPAPDLSQKTLDETVKKAQSAAWNATPQGRAFVRVFSRGIVGAGAFTAGGIMAASAMRHYKAGETLAETIPSFNPLKWLEKEHINPLQTLARIIDHTIAPVIRGGTKLITGSEEMAAASTHFRPTRIAGAHTGRTLGQEIVGVTFDFGAASIGDAVTRDAFDAIDPAVKKSWINENGSFDYDKMAKSAAKASWRYVTYNQGEDWAVALPYVYYMKGQRSLINHHSPGFDKDFDHGMNGGAMKTRQVGDENHVVGNYHKEGIADLTSRFTVYNMGTLMYREAYDYVGNRLAGKQGSLYGSLEENAQKSTLQQIADIPKWMARSVIKAGIYMPGPALIFSLIRTPQHRYKGIMVDQDHDAFVMYDHANASNRQHPDTVHVGEPFRLNNGVSTYDKTTPVFLRKQEYENGSYKWNNLDVPISNPHAHVIGDTYDMATQFTHGDLDHYVFNPIAKGSNAVRRGVQKLAPAAGYVLANNERPLNDKSFNDFKQRMNMYAGAAMAYTPYMWSKAETARLWDDGKMDLSAERMIDGITHLSLSETAAGAHEIWNSILQKPLPDAEREKEAKQRKKEDTSPSDAFHDTKDPHGARAQGKGKLDPEQYKKKNDQFVTLVGEKPDASLLSHSAIIPSSQNKSWTQQELERMPSPSSLTH